MSDYVIYQRQRLDEQFQLAFAKQGMSYEYSETNNGDLIITIPNWCGGQYKSIRVVDEDGKMYNYWQPLSVSPRQLLKREVTGRPIRL